MGNPDILEQQAIDAAINAEWEIAVEKNEQILKEYSNNLDACLRLGYAHLQLNNLKEAQKYYKKALRIQPKNNIASDHLEKIEILIEKKKSKSTNSVKYDPDSFLEIPGKTKSVYLVNLGQKEDLAGRSVGEEVVLKEKKHRLEVRTFDNDYIGTLPDDISKRLLYFIKENSTYKTYIKEIDLSEVVVFIKEIEKGGKVRQYPSFPSNPHIMLTDIKHSDDDEENNSTNEKDEDSDEEEEEVDIEEEQWGEFDTEGKEDLQRYVDVEEVGDDDEEEE